MRVLNSRFFWGLVYAISVGALQSVPVFLGLGRCFYSVNPGT